MFEFRAYDMKNKKMIYNGGQIRTTEGCMNINEVRYCPFSFILKNECSPIGLNLEFMLYTTKTDVNGKKIFQKDIVRVSWYDQGGGTRSTTELVDWCEEYTGFDIFRHYKRIEVIGNIFETPELLEE